MNRDQLHITKKAMREYGGGFVTALADLLDVADGSNQENIVRTWPELFGDAGYGPGSPFYKAVVGKQS